MAKNEERPAVRTTIVGGRPPGSGKEIGPVPKGIDAVIQKAAGDIQFAGFLLGEEISRKEAVQNAGIVLSESEMKMLESVDKEQLRTIIRSAREIQKNSTPPLKEVRIEEQEVRTRGIRPDRPQRPHDHDKPIRMTGIRPDSPRKDDPFGPQFEPTKTDP